MSGTQNGRSPRSVALVGPYSSGKSTLFEALMEAAGAPVKRPADPRNRPATTEVRLGHCTYLGDAWSVLDCPGSIEFAYETSCALAMVDLAVVVCEPAPARALTVAPLLKLLADEGVPHMLFINKIDTLEGSVRDTLAALQGLCRIAAGAAAGADHRWRDGQRLCRCGERARVSLSQGPALGADADSVRAAGRRAGGTEQAGRGAGGSRRRAAGEGAGGRQADHRGDLQRPAQGPRGRRGDRGAAGFGGERRRRAAAVEGAAARHADAAARPPRARASPPTDRRWRRSSRQCMPATPASCPMRASGAARSRTARRWAARGWAASIACRAANWRRSPRRSRAIWSRWDGWMACRPAPRFRPARRRSNCRSPQPPPPVYSLAIATTDHKDDVKLSGALQKQREADPTLTVEQRAGHQRDGAARSGRDAPERDGRAAGEGLRAEGDDAQAAGGVQGDHPPRGARAWPAEEAERRARPVRRREDRHRAARARRGLRVHRQDRRRRGAAQLHSGGGRGGGGSRRRRGRSASRWWTSR